MFYIALVCWNQRNAFTENNFKMQEKMQATSTSGKFFDQVFLASYKIENISIGSSWTVTLIEVIHAGF